jgi:3-oxoacyl-[acyl-carrier-protein] synthase III
MLGIKDIKSYIPDNRISNYDKIKTFNLTEDFINNKIGVKYTAKIHPNQDTSDLCCEAFNKLLYENDLDENKIDVVIVCTQNPDFNLPHTSAIVHGKLNLPAQCAAFDISLGCSGYVYGLEIIQGFMESAKLNHGVLFTADPYSKVIDTNDKNTTLLFGDAATATYFNRQAIFIKDRCTFGTQGQGYKHLLCENGKLSMNGREIFNFAARTVPGDIKKVLDLNNMKISDVDLFLFHQASKYIIDFLRKKIGLPKEKSPYVIENYGNTVSSSIPILLEKYLTDITANQILLSGFGVGLSWASGILHRVES